MKQSKGLCFLTEISPPDLFPKINRCVFLLYTRYYTINITSFHIFASSASGDRISIYAKMLKSTAYLRPCSVRQSKTLPLRQEGVAEGGGSVYCSKVPFCKVVYYKVDSYIFVWKIVTSPTLPNTKMSE